MSPTPLLVDPRTGMFHRDSDLADDVEMIREARREYRDVPLNKGTIALDLGAHIGGFADMVLAEGGRVAAVEPDEGNIRVLRANLKRWPASRWTLEPVACVDDNSPTTTLYVNQGRGKCMHSLVTKGRKQPVTVKAMSLGKLLAKYKPNTLKADIECYEYELQLLRALPKYVRVLALELHLNGHRRELGWQLHRAILKQGFTAIKEPRGLEAWDKHWGTVPVYVR